MATMSYANDVAARHQAGHDGQWLRAHISILRAQTPPHAPTGQGRGDLVGDEVSRTLLVVAFAEELVVVGEGVAYIGDERQPCRGLRRRDVQSRAIDGMVHHRG